MNNVDDGMICAGVDQGGDSKLPTFDAYGVGGWWQTEIDQLCTFLLHPFLA